MTFCKNSIRISCQIIFVNKYWPQSCLCPFKKMGMFFLSYSELSSKFGAMPFQEYITNRSSHPFLYGDLVYKLRRVRGSSNFISSRTVKRLRRQQYDPGMHRKDNIWSCTWLFYVHVRLSLKHCTLTNNAVGKDKVPNFVSSDFYSGLLQPLVLTSLTDWSDHSLLLWMSPGIFHKTYYHQHLCAG